MKTKKEKIVISQKNQDKDNFLNLLFLSFIHPLKLSQKISGFNNLAGGFYFLLQSLSLALVIYILQKAVFIKKSDFIFSAISEMMLLIPIYVLIFFLAGLIFHLFAKVMSGKGSLKDSLTATFYSSAALVFTGVPYVGYLCFLWFIFLLTIIFQKKHGFYKINAVVNVAVPSFFVLYLAVLMDILNIAPLIGLGRNVLTQVLIYLGY